MAFGVVVTKRPLSWDIYDTPLLISMGTLIGDTEGLAHHLSLIHISEPTRLGMISYAVFCLKKKNKVHTNKKSKNAILVMCYGIL